MPIHDPDVAVRSRRRCARFWLLALTLTGCGLLAPSEEEVRKEFRDYVAGANQCARDEECALASADCPLGCYVAVRADRKAQVEAKARELVEAYSRGGRACAYGCVPAGPIVCREQRCFVSPYQTPDAGP
jgi:hypothetical protein